MGMAASQARLLTLTARIHDMEYSAQAIQNAKIQLATQSDSVYKDYLGALDATTLTFNTINNSGVTSLISATFSNLCGVNRLTSANGSTYALRNKHGSIVVSQEVFEGYHQFQQAGYKKTAYDFAVYMLGDIQGQATHEDIREAEIVAYDDLIAELNADPDDQSERTAKIRDLQSYHERLEQMSVDNGDIYDENDVTTHGTSRSEYYELLNCYKKLLYELAAEEICNEADGNGVNSQYDESLFEYYVDIYNQIQAAGGNCISINDYDGPDGNASNDTEWLEAMIQSGTLTIHSVNTDNKTGYVTFNGTSPSSDSSLQYVQTTTVDKTALKKAEAKYEHEMKQINQKDKKFDMDLSKIETERQAANAELESVKKVLEKNVDRTFKIFSS